ncbi:HAD family hydrolase [Paraliobacillus sp. X-1268]|uniref:HAD family hydrolase n=1 Tax=Paraliobacillus sp. X-1268 TaxID=2213193 RepID=UPI000E3DC9A9|nr:HAD family hydrolase [Paraliobacillus sp. X-1268]
MKAIIFDFDGTLANTLPICYVAFQSVFKEFDNKDLSSEDIRSMFGPSETGIIIENLKNTNKENAIELYYEKYLEYHEQLVKPNNDITEMIGYLKEKDIKTGIVTGKARRSLDISLKALHMDNLFEIIITGDDVIHPKPHPEGVVKALSLLEVERNDSMFIGESDADIEAGLKANVTTAGVKWLPDYQPSEFSVKPNYIFDRVTDLKRHLEKGVHSEL